MQYLTVNDLRQIRRLLRDYKFMQAAAMMSSDTYETKKSLAHLKELGRLTLRVEEEYVNQLANSGESDLQSDVTLPADD